MRRGEYYDEERVAGTHLDIQQGGAILILLALSLCHLKIQISGHF